MRLPLTAILAAGLATTGCMNEEAAMFIEGALPLAPDACEVANNNSVFLPSGTLDLGRGGGGYSSFLKVRTNLPATFNNQDVQQDQTRSPNYPDYGAVDNNVVIFETAEVTLSLESDTDTIAALRAALNQVDGANLECSATECHTKEIERVPAAGTVFNTQTQLNQPAVVAAEVLPGTFAQTLRALYEAAKGTEAQALDKRTFLDVPGEKQRLNLEIVLVGRTTGSQNLRTVRSAPFPFGIDICIGCLAPDEALCNTFNAVSVPIPEAQACIEGQDFSTNVCVCVDANNDGRPDSVDSTGGKPFIDGDGNPLRAVVNDPAVCGGRRP
jgi:hypothetical protein